MKSQSHQTHAPYAVEKLKDFYLKRGYLKKNEDCDLEH